MAWSCPTIALSCVTRRPYRWWRTSWLPTSTCRAETSPRQTRRNEDPKIRRGPVSNPVTCPIAPLAGRTWLEAPITHSEQTELGETRAAGRRPSGPACEGGTDPQTQAPHKRQRVLVFVDLRLLRPRRARSCSRSVTLFLRILGSSDLNVAVGPSSATGNHSGGF